MGNLKIYAIFLGGKYRLTRIVCLDKVSHFCTMIVNYGTKQETINLYHQCGLSKQYSVCKQKGNRLANHRGIYIGKCLKKNKENHDEAIHLQIRRA